MGRNMFARQDVDIMLHCEKAPNEFGGAVVPLRTIQRILKREHGVRMSCNQISEKVHWVYNAGRTPAEDWWTVKFKHTLINGYFEDEIEDRPMCGPTTNEGLAYRASEAQEDRRMDAVNKETDIKMKTTYDSGPEDKQTRKLAAHYFTCRLENEYNLKVPSEWLLRQLEWTKPHYLAIWRVEFNMHLSITRNGFLLSDISTGDSRRDEEDETVEAEATDYIKRVVKIDGVPVGWAWCLPDGTYIGAIDSMLIDDQHTRWDGPNPGHINFGVTDSMQHEPREPGFYKYTEGKQGMLFLLRNNTESNSFFRSQGLVHETREKDWQWAVLNDNGDHAPCDWGYIEQALSGGNKLVKI